VKVIIVGATGMIGQGVLRECLLDPEVEEVLTVGRSASGQRHAKLREVVHTDFLDYSPVEDELRDRDACFYCLGVSSVGMTEADYTRVSYDYPMAAARLLAEIDPQTCFVYVSGAGTNPQGRQMWARVKGRTELEVIELLPRGYAVRPGMIQPTHGVRSKTRWYNAIYTAVAPAIPLLERIAPKYVTTTDRLARSMLQLARVGFPRHILENADLR
jgi:nucleoside-diphosphate-sugar epimerase